MWAQGAQLVYAPTKEAVTVVSAHFDDPPDVYYTVLMADGREKQTTVRASPSLVSHLFSLSPLSSLSSFTHSLILSSLFFLVSLLFVISLFSLVACLSSLFLYVSLFSSAPLQLFPVALSSFLRARVSTVRFSPCNNSLSNTAA